MMTNPLNIGNSICEELIEMIFDDEKYERWKHTRYTMNPKLAEQFEIVTDKPRIVIIGDYDVDGTMGVKLTVTLVSALHPNAEVNYIAPKRFTDGYGINKNIAEAIMSEFAPQETCIITVDNGISQFDSLNLLYEKGYAIAITDHHAPQTNEDGSYKLPLHDVLVNPHVKFNGKSDFTFEHYCGAGVIYQLAKALIKDKDIIQRDFLPYAAIATIADVMPIIEDNWMMVGELLNNLQVFPDELNFTNKPKKYINESDIGFTIGPTLNAAGRLLDDGATKVLEYLFNPTEAGKKVLQDLNEQRKALVKEQEAMAFEYIKEHNLEQMEPIMVNIPGLHHGIIGIVAGKITEKYKRACLLCSDGKGSGRAPAGFDIFEFGMAHIDLFDKFGGHEGACGFSISDEHFAELAKFAKPKDVSERKEYDIFLEHGQISEFYLKTAKYRPFGNENPAPRCMVSIRPEDNITFNKKGAPQHLFVINKDGSKISRFNHIDPTTGKAGHLADPKAFDGVGEIDLNYFNNELTPQLNIREVYEPEDAPVDMRRY